MKPAREGAEDVTLCTLLEALFLQGEGPDAELARSVPRALWDDALLAPLRDFLARPNKGFRAGLVELGYRLSGGRETRPPIELPLLIECLHAGSLIIDDIEDLSEERRGAPALHRVYGVPRALNAGNWLYFWPQVLLSRVSLSPLSRLCVHERVALCLLRCHEGQALDLSVRVDQLPQQEVGTVVRAVTSLKTGGLLGLAVALGAIAAEAPHERLDALTALGCELGVALQMLDDVSGLLNVSRRHKALEDLRLARATWVWALAAEQLDRSAFAALVGELRPVTEGQPGDALMERLRFGVGGLALQRAREHVRGAVDVLARAIGRGAWCDGVLEQFAWLERRYVQA